MQFLKKTINDFLGDDCMTQAAALAYFTLFALPPLLLVIISVVGLVLGHEAAQGKIQAQIQGLMGTAAGQQVGTIVAKAGQHTSSGTLGTIVGLVALIFGATGAFTQLQTSLNTVWHVKPDPKAGGIKAFITLRILSFGMVVSVGFLLLVSLVVSAALDSVGGIVAQWIPSIVSRVLIDVAGFIVSLAIISALFAAMFKVLPDARLAWRQVWAGAVGTALLFNVGKYLIGLYLGKSGVASAYGEAGSLILIVLWIYYSSLIVLLGAESTKAWSILHGERIEPKAGAVLTDAEEVNSPSPSPTPDREPVLHQA
jgi:membrane protein